MSAVQSRRGVAELLHRVGEKPPSNDLERLSFWIVSTVPSQCLLLPYYPDIKVLSSSRVGVLLVLSTKRCMPAEVCRKLKPSMPACLLFHPYLNRSACFLFTQTSQAGCSYPAVY